jgi:hypothetical protein
MIQVFFCLIRRRAALAVLPLCATVLASAAAEAQTVYTWQSGNGNWGSTSKWLPIGVPNAIDDTARYGGGFAANVTATLADASGADASFTLGSLLITVRNGSNVFRRIANVTSGTGVLIFDVSSGTATINSETLNTAGAAKDVFVGIKLNDPLWITNNTSTASGTGGVMTFSKAIMDGSSSNGLTIGAITSGSAAPVVFQGVNTYTGNTTIFGSGSANRMGWLQLDSTSETLFKLQNANVSNSILSGSSSLANQGKIELDGLLRIDTSSLTATSGTWNLVDVAGLNESFGGSFGLAFVGGPAFTNAGSGTYTSGSGSNQWTFSQATGNIVLVPEPSTIALAGIGIAAAGWTFLRRRR